MILKDKYLYIIRKFCKKFDFNLKNYSFFNLINEIFLIYSCR